MKEQSVLQLLGRVSIAESGKGPGRLLQVLRRSAFNACSRAEMSVVS